MLYSLWNPKYHLPFTQKKKKKTLVSNDLWVFFLEYLNIWGILFVFPFALMALGKASIYLFSPNYG